MGDRRADVGAGQRFAHRGDRIEAGVHRAIAVGVHVRINAGATECDEHAREAVGREIHRRAAARSLDPLRRGRAAAVAAVGLDDGAGECGRGDDAIKEELRVPYRDAGRRLRGALVEALAQAHHAGNGRGDRVCLGRGDLRREMRPHGEHAGLLNRGECRNVRGGRVRVEEARDALLVHRHERGGRCRAILRGGGLWYQRRVHLEGRILEEAVRRSTRLAPDLAAERVFRRGGQLCKLECARVGEGRVAEGRANQDRPLGLQHIKRRAARLDARRQHAFLEPADDLEPAIGLVRDVLVEARLDALLELRDGERLVVKTALEKLAPRLERMHVAIDETRHQEATFEIDHGSRWADVGLDGRVEADEDDPAAGDGKRLGVACRGIGSKDDAVPEHAIGRTLGRPCARERRESGEDEYEDAQQVGHGRYSCGGRR